MHDQFYCKWVNDIDLFYAKKNTKTMRISFKETDIWNKESPVQVKEYLKKIRFVKEGRIKFPIPLYINVRDGIVHSIPKAIFLSSYRAAIGHYPEFAIFQSEPEKALLTVSLTNHEMDVSLSSVAHCTFHSINKRDNEGFASGIATDTLIGCAVALAQIGQREMAAKILFDSRFKKRFIQNRDVLVYLLPYLFKTSYFSQAIDIVNDVLASESDNMLEIMTVIAALFEANPEDEEKTTKIEEFLKKCLEKYLALNERPLIGVSHYNIGNHYRSRRLFRAAIKHYLKARRYEKNYLNQAYYYQELAGTLFGYDKYHFSSLLYKKALDKGATESVKPLFADALMFSGKYQSALAVFSEYLKSKTEEHDEWHLKAECLNYLIERTLITQQTRRKKEALAAVDITKASDPGFIKSLESAFELDALCGLAWFNLGIAHSKAGNHKDAVFSFTICGLVQTWDIQAWVNAVLCCFNEGIPLEILPLILRTGFYINGDDFLSNLYKELNKRIGPDVVAEITSRIEEILPRKVNNKPTVRVMGADGKFRNIFKEKV